MKKDEDRSPISASVSKINVPRKKIVNNKVTIKAAIREEFDDTFNN
ncbi:hypothetical protein [Neobacillus sp. 19]